MGIHSEDTLCMGFDFDFIFYDVGCGSTTFLIAACYLEQQVPWEPSIIHADTISYAHSSTVLRDVVNVLLCGVFTFQLALAKVWCGLVQIHPVSTLYITFDFDLLLTVIGCEDRQQ